MQNRIESARRGKGSYGRWQSQNLTLRRLVAVENVQTVGSASLRSLKRNKELERLRLVLQLGLVQALPLVLDVP